MTEKMMPMFTYGILKYPRNIIKEGGRDIVENCTLSGHKMYVVRGGGFPVTRVTEDDNDVIYGTYFEIPEQIVTLYYDRIEGYSPYRDKRHNMYNREIVQVTTPDGQILDANMYIANASFFRDNFTKKYLVESGNYDDARLTL